MLADRERTPLLVASTKLEKGLRAYDYEGTVGGSPQDRSGEPEETEGVEEKEEECMKKDRDEFERCMEMANQAKDRLAEIAERLEEAGYIRKAKSCMNIVYWIEAWQNRN